MDMDSNKILMNKMCLLSCVKRGYISIDKAVKKLGWSKQKVVAIGCLLAQDGMLEKVYFEYHNFEILVGFNLK